MESRDLSFVSESPKVKSTHAPHDHEVAQAQVTSSLESSVPKSRTGVSVMGPLFKVPDSPPISPSLPLDEHCRFEHLLQAMDIGHSSGLSDYVSARTRQPVEKYPGVSSPDT